MKHAKQMGFFLHKAHIIEALSSKGTYGLYLANECAYH
jgi:hypothetical protein